MDPPPTKRSRKEEKKHALETNTWTRCMHYIAKKQRPCNIPRAKDSIYCSHHDTSTASLRTPCPVDPSHSVWTTELECHVAKCATAVQHKERLALPYFKERYNCGGAFKGELEAIDLVYSLLNGAEERKEKKKERREEAEEEEEEEDGEGLAKGVEVHKGAREGTLTALFKHQSTLTLSIPDLCQRLVHWASTPESAPITNPRGRFLVHDRAMPCLRSTLANMRTDGEGEAGEEAAAVKVVGSKAATFRHELQQASIISNTLLAVRGVGEGGEGGSTPQQAFGARLLTLPLGESDASPLFVEFGAGRGMLSFTLDNMLPTPCRMLLLERASIGGKKVDKELRQEAKTISSSSSSSSSSAPVPTSTAHRLRLDIQDCALREALDHFSPQGGGVVAIGKHLCGAATDLTLRCLAESVGNLGGSMEAVRVAAGDVAAAAEAPQPSSALPPTVHALKAISIALCCHHACSWREYVGKTWWREVFKGSAVDFEVCRYLSSWALLEEGRGEVLVGCASPPTLPPLTLSPEWATSLSVASKAWIGRAAKRAIDAGRLSFMGLALKGGGELIEYCPPRVSLENILLLHSAS